MPSIVHAHELDDPDQGTALDPVVSHRFAELDEVVRSHQPPPAVKVTSPEGTEEVYTPDEACDLILDLAEQQFWEWYDDPACPRRFKPRVKVYEVS